MDSAMKLEIASQPRWKIRRNASADMIWASILPASSALLILSVVRSIVITSSQLPWHSECQPHSGEVRPNALPADSERRPLGDNKEGRR